MHRPAYSSPYLKEEAQHNKGEESQEKKHSEEKMEPPHIKRDPWAELLFGRRPRPPQDKKD